jgi:hypothetical protein
MHTANYFYKSLGLWILPASGIRSNKESPLLKLDVFPSSGEVEYNTLLGPVIEVNSF